MDPQTHFVVMSSVPESIIGLDILRSFHDSYIGSQTCGVRAVIICYYWKDLMEAFTVASARENRKKNNIACLPGETTKISATVKD